MGLSSLQRLWVDVFLGMVGGDCWLQCLCDGGRSRRLVRGEAFEKCHDIELSVLGRELLGLQEVLVRVVFIA